MSQEQSQLTPLHNEVIFELQKIAFASIENATRPNAGLAFKSIAQKILAAYNIRERKTFCKICWTEIPNPEQENIYFCEECDKLNK